MGSSWSYRRRNQYPHQNPPNYYAYQNLPYPIHAPHPPYIHLPPPSTYYSNFPNYAPHLNLPAEPPTPRYVDHSSAKKIKSQVNVHKDTISIYSDHTAPDTHLVSFTFDALDDGCISVFYFAKEGSNSNFTPLYPGIYKPVRIPFNKGLGQRFIQPPKTGIDLGFFDFNDLSKSTPQEDIFPLVIYAEMCFQGVSTSAQVTQAVLKRDDAGHFQVSVIKQILWVGGNRYELREIYGISNSDEIGVGDNDTGKECVICMSEPKDTAALPCRHMCLCRECAKELRLQSNKCPICRQPIQELMEIKVSEEV